MADVTVLRHDEMESAMHGGFVLAAKSLGVTSFGMNVIKMPAGYDGYPLHDHAGDGQEEVYVVARGSATLEADGETWELTPGTYARVAAGQQRKVTPGDDGVVMTVIGGVPGQAFEPRWAS